MALWTMDASQRRIISASRRTDIPAFYSRWLLRRLEEGFCEWIRPFGGGVARTSLRAEDCLAMVFWTRNPAPLLPALGDIRAAGHFFYFQFTVTGYPRELESHTPPLEAALKSFRDLADQVGPEAVIWRYDPIILSDRTPPEFHLENFGRIAQALEGATTQAYFSFVDLYGKTRRGFEAASLRAGIAFRKPDPPEQRDLVLRLRDLAARRGMDLFACCEDALVDPAEGILKGRCVDLDLVRRLRPDALEDLKRQPTREECGCSASTDIGAYDTCPFGCMYCYATRSREAVLDRTKKHDPSGTLL